MSRRQMKSDAITAALHGQGYGGVEADVDREGICYLSGDVLSADEEAAIVVAETASDDAALVRTAVRLTRGTRLGA